MRLKKLALSLLIAAAANPAWALGLGQIQVKSRINEPLLADIPVITSDASELAELQAKLASPETFARIGLPLPDRLVSDLHFNVIDGDDGKVYIRVTSSAPVSQPLVNFLVEVNWGQGKLVREYSALVATPNTVAATTQPVIEAPTVAAPANTIDRSTAPAVAAPLPTVPAAAAPTPTVASVPAPPAPTAVATPAPGRAGPVVVATPPPPPAPSVETVAPVSPSATVSRPQAQASGQTYGPIRAGETLSAITGSMPASGQAPDEVMQALVALNPDAFIGGNPNRLRAGAVLRMPEGTEPPDQAAQAAARVAARSNAEAARSSRRPTPRAVDVASAPAPTPARPLREPKTTSPAAAPAAHKRTADARLRIVPAASNTAPAAAAGSAKSGRGTSGGDGDMLQQLQTSQETIATRDAEIRDLKSRVTELEQLQQKQQQLIAMKNSELAAAQQKLAARGTQTAPAAAPSASVSPLGGLWWLLPAALAAAVLLGLMRWLRGRRHATPQPAREPRPVKTKPAKTQSAKGFGFGSRRKPVDEVVEPAAMSPELRSEPGFTVPAATAAAVAASPADVREDGLPTWARGDAWMPDNALRGAVADPVQTHPSSDFVASAATMAPSEPAPAPIPVRASPPTESDPVDPIPQGPVNSHVQLAQTYIDLGDADTARTILQGVLDNGDASARAQALAVLRNIG